MKKFSIATLILILLSITSQVTAAVRAWVNQSTVYVGDPVTLTIEADNQSAPRPDLSVLEKDFRILGTGTSTHVSIVNGRSSATKSWNITLQPLGQGKLSIPSIAVGKEKTQPLTVTVTDIPEQVKAKLRDHVMLEASVSNSDEPVYVQQQVSYTIKLFTDGNVISGELIAPQIDNAVVEQISADKRYQVVRNGKSFNVIERHYVISPERSGELHIPPAQFRGRLKEPKKQQPRRHPRSPFDDFFNDDFFNDDFFSGTPFGDPGKPIRTSSNAIDIKVLPVPDAYHGKHWLPAEEVKIQDSWKTHLPEFKVGEPVVRSLRFQARGVAGSQIPPLDIATPNGMKVYPDPAKTDTLTDGEMAYGVSEQSITYIPNQAGKITIPEVKIDWWDTIAGKQQTTSVPAITVEVQPGAGGKTRTTSSQPTVQQIPEKKTGNTATSEQSPADSSTRIWPYLALLALLITGGIAWRWVVNARKPAAISDKNDQTTAMHRPVSAAIDKHMARRALKQACDDNDAQKAAQQLLLLAKAQWPDNPPQSLGALADRLAEGADTIRELDQYLYGTGTSHWNGSKLWNTVKDGFQPRLDNPDHKQAGMAALYPNRDEQ